MKLWILPEVTSHGHCVPDWMETFSFLFSALLCCADGGMTVSFAYNLTCWVVPSVDDLAECVVNGFDVFLLRGSCHTSAASLSETRQHKIYIQCKMIRRYLNHCLITDMRPSRNGSFHHERDKKQNLWFIWTQTWDWFQNKSFTETWLSLKSVLNLALLLSVTVKELQKHTAVIKAHVSSSVSVNKCHSYFPNKPKPYLGEGHN